MEVPDFNGYEDIAPWFALHGEPGLNALRNRGYNQIFNGSDIQQRLVRGWLDQHDVEIAEGIAFRHVAAAEKASTAAVDSATHAQHSAIAAFVAAGLAAAALGVSIAAFFK